MVVDLSTGVIVTEPTEKYAHKWIGGRGINQWILYNELKPWVTPYEPANIIAIGTGPLAGTLAAGACRHSVDCKNAFNGGVGSSNSGGHFASGLKFAGYDSVVFQGRARQPVYLWINDDQVELRDASHLWGKTTWETEDLIREELGNEKVQVLCIGPAGENLVRGACVIANRNRAAGKCGCGAVMGSKNLKAVAIRGTGSVEVAHPDRFMRAVDDMWRVIQNDPVEKLTYRYGSAGILPMKNKTSGIPYKNFQDNWLPSEAVEKLHPDVFDTKYRQRMIGYMACPMACSSFYKVDHGPYAGLANEGFELEDIINYGGKLAIDYAPAIIKIHALYNQLGIDEDGGTGPISWAFECYQRGILTEKDTDGLKLEWGDYEVVIELIRKTANREGFGNILAEGSKRASEIVGRASEYYAITMKGQELYEEVRVPLGWGLGACVATRGGGHTSGAPCVEMFPESELGKKIWGKDYHVATSYEGKPQLVRYFEQQQAIINSLGVCMYMSNWMGAGLPTLKEYAELYSAATGWETTEDELRKAGERMLNLEKAFNVLHADLGREDDYPPERLLKEPIISGQHAGFTLSKEEYDKMLNEYYECHGWDPETGLQTKKCLEELDLRDVADDLVRAGKLG